MVKCSIYCSYPANLVILLCETGHVFIYFVVIAYGVVVLVFTHKSTHNDTLWHHRLVKLRMQNMYHNL